MTTGLARAAGPGWVRQPRARRISGDRGSGTVIVAGLIGVLCIIGTAIIVIATARTARHQAETAADLAALAAAGVLLDGSADPCTEAGRIAALNDARLTGCALDGQTVAVSVVVPVQLGRFGIGEAAARARAGPVDAAPPT